MILPVGDLPNPRGFRPWTNWALIALNVAVHLFVALPGSLVAADPRDPALWEYLHAVGGVSGPGALLAARQVTVYDLVVFEHGFRTAAPELADLFTAMFLHANFAHLAGNMLFLWIYGDNVEHRLGRLGYLLAYLGTGVAATLGYAAVTGPSQVPLVGASGAISGVLGLYFVLFPRNRVKLLVLFFPFLVDVWLVSARFVLGAYVVFDNLLPFLVGARSGVAYGAHLGGFFAGAALALLLLRRRGRRRRADDLLAWHLAAARQLLAVGRPAAALRHLDAVVALAPESAEADEARRLVARLSGGGGRWA